MSFNFCDKPYFVVKRNFVAETLVQLKKKLLLPFGQTTLEARLWHCSICIHSSNTFTGKNARESQLNSAHSFTYNFTETFFYIYKPFAFSQEHKQMYCRDGCRCEQQYTLHRLLAYDPNNECRGIFSDWFSFPSSCICRCYDLPLEFRVTSRSPRSRKHRSKKTRQSHNV